MKIAIMQPYIFPYLGYFQLIHAVDTFVFYDDVNFIKRGWINRNRILVNGCEHLITMPLKRASQNRLIKDIELAIDKVWLQQFYKTIEQNYKHAPYYEPTLKLIQSSFESSNMTISELAMQSVKVISEYIGIDTTFKQSSLDYPETIIMGKSERLIAISKLSGGDYYVNPSGGKQLYNKIDFKLKGVNLSFIENELLPYRQFDNTFVGALSIIDVLMFNSKAEINKQLTNYKLT